MQNAEFYRKDSSETTSARRIQRGGLWGFSGRALQVQAIRSKARAPQGERTSRGLEVQLPLPFLAPPCLGASCAPQKAEVYVPMQMNEKKRA